MWLCGVDRFKIAAFANQPSRKTTASPEATAFQGGVRDWRCSIYNLESLAGALPLVQKSEVVENYLQLFGDKIETRILL